MAPLGKSLLSCITAANPLVAPACMAFTNVQAVQQSTYCISCCSNHIETPALVDTKHPAWFQIVLDLSNPANNALRNIHCEGPF